tara:strand:+ start:2188 stop:2922 length:735 start_codon:yes stop_codon:yes gene_type:complete
MAWFSKKKTPENKENGLTKIDSFMTTSFAHVKNDMQIVVEWLNFFNKKNDENDLKFAKTEQRLAQIEQHLSFLPSIHAQLQNLQNQDDKQHILLQKVRNLHNKVSMMDHDHSPILMRLREIEQSLLSPKTDHIPVINKMNEMASRLQILENQPISKPKVTVKDKLYATITRNSKDYVKKIILNLISKYESISATQLKQIVVDEQGLCSKSSFYRLLKEAEESDFIDVVTQGKEKRFIAKQLSSV